jgi:hypothetical protein
VSSKDEIQRNVLPIPDSTYVCLTTYDAKAPAAKFPPIEPMRPPKGAPTCRSCMCLSGRSRLILNSLAADTKASRLLSSP